MTIKATINSLKDGPGQVIRRETLPLRRNAHNFMGKLIATTLFHMGDFVSRETANRLDHSARMVLDYGAWKSDLPTQQYYPIHYVRKPLMPGRLSYSQTRERLWMAKMNKIAEGKATLAEMNQGK